MISILQPVYSQVTMLAMDHRTEFTPRKFSELVERGSG
jgi:hypothetical protein